MIKVYQVPDMYDEKQFKEEQAPYSGFELFKFITDHPMKKK